MRYSAGRPVATALTSDALGRPTPLKEMRAMRSTEGLESLWHERRRHPVDQGPTMAGGVVANTAIQHVSLFQRRRCTTGRPRPTWRLS